MAGAYGQVLEEHKRPRWGVRSFLAKPAGEGAYNSLIRDLQHQSGYENSQGQSLQRKDDVKINAENGKDFQLPPYVNIKEGIIKNVN